jgi:SpoVK/Ycf46/Vps4 family AAA+-type ATPase
VARGDLLKKLFRAYVKANPEDFNRAAQEIILEERKKHHSVLANELTQVLADINGSYGSKTVWERFPKPPVDPDRGAPLLSVRRPDRLLDELILDPRVASLLDRVTREFREWDVLEAHGLTPSHRLLFCGPPGCGKTATAEALACQIGLPLIYVRFDGVVSSFLGQTAQNLRAVFDYAAQDQWVLFFDEFDAIGRSRDDATEHSEIKRVVNTFLQILDNFRGRCLVIAATNFEQSLDPALWRRFDEILRFERPRPEDVLHLLKWRLGDSSMQLDLPRHAARLAGLSHAEVERVSFDALKSCFLDGRRRVSEDDLVQAVAHHDYRVETLKRSQASLLPRVDLE